MTMAHPKFRELVAPHLTALFRSAYRLTGNRQDAEDVVQEVCVRAYTHLASLSTLEQPKSWLLKIAYRVFVDGLRRRTRSPVRATAEDFDSTRSSDEPTPEERAEAELAERRVLGALAKLDREQRALIALQVEGYTLAELDHDGIFRRAKARLYRARAPRQLLAADGKTPRAGEMTGCNDIASVPDAHRVTRLAPAGRRRSTRTSPRAPTARRLY
jgi:RNA polymerase sigma-70 factor (ECF subfamily)